MNPSLPAGHLPRVLAVVPALLLLLALLVGVPVGPASADADDVTVELVAVAPTVVGPDATQRVTARVTNPGTDPVTGLRAELGVGWRVVSTRADVAAWADGGRGVATGQLDLPLDDLDPGESTEVTFELDVATLQLGADAEWGPREMSVRVTDGSGTVAVLHSFLLYDPDGGTPRAGRTAPDAIGLAVVAPLTGPALDPAAPAEYVDAVADATGAGGTYARLLDAATTGSAALSLAVDPAVVAAAATSTDDTANGWAGRLQRAGGADVAVLPPYDTDLAALAHADVTATDVAATTSLDLVADDWAAPGRWTTSVAWPVGAPDRPTLATAAAAGAQHVVVESGARPTAEGAASAVGTAPAGGRDVPVVVADETLGALVAGTGTGASTTELVQHLLADTAVLAGEQRSPAGDRDVVAAMPRGWAPDVPTFDTVLTTLAAQDWVDVSPFTQVLDAVPGTEYRVERSTVSEAELDPASVADLVTTRTGLASFATVAADPAALTGTADRDLTAPMSIAYRTDPDARATAVGLATAQADQLQDGIDVADRADVTLISDAGNLPVRIRNELPVDATVSVRLTPDDPRLVVETNPTIVVPAGTSRDAEIRVRAIGSGDVTLDVEVLAPSGVAVTDPTELTVKVRAGWETVGTAVLAGGVGLLFVAGIWRTVRRGRSDRRTTGEQVTEAAVPTGPQHTLPTDDDLPEDRAP
ncbi:DUF6049 family protein [Isoptericola dokdonensis]|uniref:Uncharacterized protein n=1 Tax=Isoptericola dokdonensis DS-3 TaxID=1300344 RepID=A0A161IJ86_9MICO|nr:DUF6049 family protein [Isoptericola dokdonensis]ANC32054.1 hypothetical protein I598_2520 [Isoptericola dokdonensis DS-3]